MQTKKDKYMIRNYKKIADVILLSMLTVAFTSVHAESTTELAKKSQNPISTMISLPIENNANFNAGPDNKVLNVLNVKPVYPVKLSSNWNLINRAIVPIISQPGVDGTNVGRKNGIGDTTYQSFFTPNTPIPMGKFKVTWGVGAQLQIPTHSNDRLGTSRWAAGPTFVALGISKHWVTGVLLTQQWDITNNKSDDDISAMVFQPFANYNFGGGWYVNTSPVITANWKAKGSDQWTIPLGGGVGRVVHIGKQAINFRASLYGNVAKPKHGSDYNVQLSAIFLFPK
jgi:hypothetical protein